MKQLDKFYTNKDVANTCVKIVSSLYDLNKFDFILEPSAGDGAFSNILEEKYNDKVLALDIEPGNDRIKKMDFFNYLPDNKKYIVIGNPPFGRVSSLAFSFLQKACSFTDVVAFILPRTFKRYSVKNRIHRHFHLVYEEDIPEGSFTPITMKAKCCFQVWEKRNIKRELIELDIETEDFEILPIKFSTEADLAVRAYGSNCGSISYEIESLAPRSWHFIKLHNPENFYKIYKGMDFSVSKDTARQDSLGAKEFIHLYNISRKST